MQRPLKLVHHTIDGPIYMETTQAEGGWKGGLWGRELDAGTLRTYKRVGDANRNLTLIFAQMFREHRCSRKCGAPANLLPTPPEVWAEHAKGIWA